MIPYGGKWHSVAVSWNEYTSINGYKYSTFTFTATVVYNMHSNVSGCPSAPKPLQKIPFPTKIVFWLRDFDVLVP